MLPVAFMSSVFEDGYRVRWYKADLHIHTVLSPCADLSMGPKNIIDKSLEHGLEVIAITDHNSCDNVKAILDAAKKTTLTVIPGMEVYTREEAHLICLFSSLQADLQFQKLIHAHLPEGQNDPDWFGPQYIVDANENILEECPRLLALATDLNAKDVLDAVERLGGIAYPAHIDRKANSLLRALGFIPNNWPIYAVEISKTLIDASIEHRFLKNTPYTVIRSSDAHFIEHLGEKHTFFKLEKPTFDELCLAIKKEGGRSCALAL